MNEPERFVLLRAWGAATGAVVGGFLLSLDAAVWLLLGLQIADFFMGVGAAFKRGDVSSHRGWYGLARKVGTWILVLTCALVEAVLHTYGVRLAIPLPELFGVTIPPVGLSSAACFAYAVIEAISLAENAKTLGLWVPRQVADRLASFTPGTPAAELPPER